MEHNLPGKAILRQIVKKNKISHNINLARFLVEYKPGI